MLPVDALMDGWMKRRRTGLDVGASLLDLGTHAVIQELDVPGNAPK
jgi:allantoicase